MKKKLLTPPRRRSASLYLSEMDLAVLELARVRLLNLGHEPTDSLIMRSALRAAVHEVSLVDSYLYLLSLDSRGRATHK